MGYIYLFKQNGSELIKIGMTDTDDITNRFNNFKMYSPKGASIVLVIQSSKPYETEQKIHKLYAHKRLSGEFFNLSENEIQDIEATFRGFDTNKVRSLFELWISDPLNNIDKLSALIANTADDIHPDSSQMYEVIERNFKGGFATATEVQSILADQLDIFLNYTPIGKLMKNKYEFKSIRREGRVFKAYFIP